MKQERDNVKFPLWRKKVDSSILEHKMTTIPKWVCDIWNLDKNFGNVTSKNDKESEVLLKFDKRKFKANIAWTKPKTRRDKVYRLWYGEELKTELKEVFLMTFMRDIEGRLRADGPDGVEIDIPFWEFLDIEFDEENRTLIFTAHYTQEPIFPELFQRLTRSPVLKGIHDELEGKNLPRIQKQGWKKRENFTKEIGAENVIYMLMDTKRKELYVGEAENLIRRFRQGHSLISNWDYYRYDVLPNYGKEFRVALESMVIRNFASVFKNKKVPSKEISDYKLVNVKIDIK